MPRRGTTTTYTVASLVACAALWVPAAAVARQKITVTVAAGDFDRRNTPVSVKLPDGTAPDADGERRLELVGPGGPLPVSVDDAGEAVFVLPALARGKKASYQLRERKGKPAKGARGGKDAAAVEIAREDKDNLWISVAGRRVLRYQAEGVTREDIAAPFVRGGYLHPVLTPGGLTITDVYPRDHKHHYGIWTAWTSTEYQGRKPDFWNLGGKKARKDHVALDSTWAGDAAGGFTARQSSTDLLASPPRKVLDETWRVAVYRTHPGTLPPPYFLFDVTSTETLVGSDPLVLPEYRYGGLGVRGSADWLGQDGARYLTSEGKDRSNGEGGTARWYHMGGKLQGTGSGTALGTLAGIAVLGHPDNFRAPQPLRIPPKEPYLVVSPPKAGKFSIEPGKPYVARYRFVVSEGAPDRELLDRLWNDYAHPPVATVGSK